MYSVYTYNGDVYCYIRISINSEYEHCGFDIGLDKIYRNRLPVFIEDK